MNLCIPHNRRTPLQAEEAIGPISIPRGSRGVPLTLKHVSKIGVSLKAIFIFHITDALFDEYFWQLTVCEVVYGYHPPFYHIPL